MVHGRVRMAGGNAVRPYALTAELIGNAADHVIDARFGSYIRIEPQIDRRRAMGDCGADLDDRPTRFRLVEHGAHHGLQEEEGSLELQGNHGVEI